MSSGIRKQQMTGSGYAKVSTFAVPAILVAVLCIAQGAAHALEPAELVPPPVPEVAPSISVVYPEDANGDAIADALAFRVGLARAQARAAATPESVAKAQTALDQRVLVELIFDSPIEQWQIDAFLALGGEITYIYKALSYGWNGTIPLGVAEDLPDLCGGSLVLVEEAAPMAAHMRLASQTGRVRPIWATGFAGGLGYNGNSTTSIAIIDSGVDDSHPDFAGRQAFWHDYSADAAGSPVDIVQHGSHVAGIALGTGASLGTGTTLEFTQSEDYSSLGSGYYYRCPFDFPSSTSNWTSTATWLGGGTGDLRIRYRSLPMGGWSTIASDVAASGVTVNASSIAMSPANAYTDALISNGAMTTMAVANSLTGFSAVGDGFNTLSGVAPGCQWVGAKVFTNAGAGWTSVTGSAIDGMVANRAAYNIKVMNLSLGTTGDPGISTSNREKINNAAANGILAVISAGNDGPAADATGEVDDPGRAAMALTVGASNDVNTLTSYTSHGFASPTSSPTSQAEDYKPDVIAPGGSYYYTHIMSVDSNDADGENAAFADVQSDDYYNIRGTSMAAPFATGCAALVIDALESTGNLTGASWDFASSADVRLVKMLLCATATETNDYRELLIGSDPTLQRAAAGPSGFPEGKDMYEGYGIINPDAAIEGGTVPYTIGDTELETLGGDVTSRRAWARQVSIAAGANLEVDVTMPVGGDFDLYLYDWTPTDYGTPVILASSTNAGTGVDEALSYSPGSATTGVLVVKRISGSGEFSLVSSDVAPSVTLTSPNGGESWAGGTAHEITWTSTGSISGVYLRLEKGGAEQYWIVCNTPDDGSYTWTVPYGTPAASDYRIGVYFFTGVTWPGDTSDANFSITGESTTVTAPNGGESWDAGTQHEITWTTTGSVTGVYIRLEKGGAQDTWLAYNTANDGSFTWNIPYGKTPGSDYRIGVYYFNGVTWLGDTSDADFTISAGDFVTVTSPNGGESWAAGTQHEITWTSTGSVSNVYIRLEKGGVHDQWIVYATPNDGSYMWTVPYNGLNIGSDYRIGIYFYTGVTWPGDTSDANFTITGESVTVTAPNGGESWNTGTAHDITWTTTGSVSGVYIRLEKGTGQQTWLAYNTPNDGSFTWSIPYGQTLGADYRIGVYYFNGVTWIGDTTDVDFTIAAGDSVTLTAPNGGETWTAGTQHEITWTSTGSVANVYLRLEKGGAEDHWIVYNTANDGSYLWTVPPGQTAGADYRVGVYFYTGATWIGDTSDAAFTID